MPIPAGSKTREPEAQARQGVPRIVLLGVAGSSRAHEPSICPVMEPRPARGSIHREHHPSRAALEVLAVFLRLGLTSFGGPVAHLGYFRREFVVRRRWLGERDYAELVALCQFLPGPASSQVGMALGLQRAGWPGGVAAWFGFTLPSALLLILFAQGARGWVDAAALHGCKVVAVAVVAQAVWGMGRSFCRSVPTVGLALVAALVALWLPGTAGQLGAIAAGGLLGLLVSVAPPAEAEARVAGRYGARVGAALLTSWAALFIALEVAARVCGSAWLAAVATFYRAGSLVFGGGHVVLPLLQTAVVPTGLVDQGAFLAGYGAAQAVPGPLFSFAAYLGTVMLAPLGGALAGCILLVALFLPGFLLVAGALPFWQALRRHRSARRAMAGINAAVVGLLLAALYDPVSKNAIHTASDAALAAAALAVLLAGRISAVWVVLATAAAAHWLAG